MCKQLLTKLQQKKESTQEVGAGTDGSGGAGTQPEHAGICSESQRSPGVDLARDVKDKQKGFSATKGRPEKMCFHC